MSIPIITLYPFDPWGTKIGGIESVIRTMIRHTPDTFSAKLIGVTEDPNQRPLNQWSIHQYEGTTVSFYPIMSKTDLNRKRWIPLFLQFSLRLRMYSWDFTDAILIFHRVEPIASSKFQAKKTILFIHGDPREITGSFSDVKWKYIPWLYQVVERTAIQKCDQIFVISKKGHQHLIEKYPKRKNEIQFFPSWYNESLFHLLTPDKELQIRNQVLKQYQLPPEKQYILFAARFEQQKNPILALKMFALFANEFEHVDLVFIGSGSLMGKMKETVTALKLSSRVHFLGHLSSSQMEQVLRIGSLYLVTSFFEGMSVSVLEALACGIPVVSTDSGEVRNLIQDGVTGFVVPEPTPEALVKSVTSILNDDSMIDRNRCAQTVAPYQSQQMVKTLYKLIMN